VLACSSQAGKAASALSHATASHGAMDLYPACHLATMPPATLPCQVQLQAHPHETARMQLATASSAAMWTPSAAHGRDADGVREESGSRAELQDLDFFRGEEGMVHAEIGDTYGKHLHMAITCTWSAHLLWYRLLSFCCPGWH